MTCIVLSNYQRYHPLNIWLFRLRLPLYSREECPPLCDHAEYPLYFTKRASKKRRNATATVQCYGNTVGHGTVHPIRHQLLKQSEQTEISQ